MNCITLFRSLYAADRFDEYYNNIEHFIAEVSERKITTPMKGMALKR